MKKIIVLITAVCLVVVLGIGVGVGIASSNEKTANLSTTAEDEQRLEEPVKVTEGIYALPSIKDKLTQEKIDEFVERFGADSNVTITDIG